MIKGQFDTKNVSVSKYRTTNPLPKKVGPCGVCAARIEGKTFALLTTSDNGSVHKCGKTTVTSRIISWHSTREAAWKARLAWRRVHKGARCYVMGQNGKSKDQKAKA